jgi:hypothetical protein
MHIPIIKIIQVDPECGNTWSSASAFSLTTEGLGLVGRGKELVLDAPVL